MPEPVVYVIASALAGIGTGLVGLSAATVMVPLLIVLCPSFQGETGAYQATAIALASDILGSAVTTATYIKHKNIDLRRGWIMLVCIVSMCTLGSLAAFKTGNRVLGGFTLFLTFFIGIRFLIKPDTQKKNASGSGKKLDAKGVAISLFFGLTIGFGTGFVGTGGGMMMLVVFTAFLGMELKTAVGTSTFIMTFTALIAAVSHILIHPAIVLERFPVLLLCMAVATAASLLSARFANRVNSRTVGRITGVLLTVMGGALILLNYREQLRAIPWLPSVVRCFGKLILFIIPAALLLITLNYTLKIPRPVFRKLLHLVAFLSTVFTVLAAENWQAASLTMILFAVIVYPILCIAQRWKGFSNLLVQKKPGEIRQSLLLLYLTDAALAAVSWGLWKSPYIAVTAILMWGIGDGNAALIGQKFGKRHVRLPFADPKKTWAGSSAMVLSSAAVGFLSLLLLLDASWPVCLLTAFVTALFGAYAEVITRGGFDTVTVPVTNAAILYVCRLLLG